MWNLDVCLSWVPVRDTGNLFKSKCVSCIVVCLILLFYTLIKKSLSEPVKPHMLLLLCCLFCNFTQLNPFHGPWSLNPILHTRQTGADPFTFWSCLSQQKPVCEGTKLCTTPDKRGSTRLPFCLRLKIWSLPPPWDCPPPLRGRRWRRCSRWPLQPMMPGTWWEWHKETAHGSPFGVFSKTGWNINTETPHTARHLNTVQSCRGSRLKRCIVWASFLLQAGLFAERDSDCAPTEALQGNRLLALRSDPIKGDVRLEMCCPSVSSAPADTTAKTECES